MWSDRRLDIMIAPWRVQGEHVGSTLPSAGDFGILDVCFPLHRVVLNVDADTLQCLLIAAVARAATCEHYTSGSIQVEIVPRASSAVS